MDAVRQRRQHNINDWMSRAERRVARAVEKGQIDGTGDARTVAQSMWIMVDGLIRTWMFDPHSFDLIKQGECMLDPYLDGLRKGCPKLASRAALK
ncbi:TetR family transcriptional regulator C-terminal domain-containing protein [Massilia sp. TN1-12]|uniref:TetR family transcriptional regulator C-terminal domain-containing protein n=1 Tax=Massilia paldalensis TaxID=3377675 RepID=UPI00385006E7